MDESYCKKCKKFKKIDQFYKSSYSQCKDCRKKVTKNNQFNKKEVLFMMEHIYNKMNSMELLYKEFLNKNSDIIDTVLIFMDKIIKEENNITNIFNSIEKKNEKIIENIETIISDHHKIH